MIITIDGLNKDQFQPLLEDMFRLRARVFAGRLGWDVTIENDMEIDQFDHMDPSYVVGVDDNMNVISCARVLQTTGPHMLSDVFSAILCGQAPVRSPNIWESTRFCVDTQRLKGEKSKHTVSTATCELMLGILEYAQDSGITDIITVIDPIMDRVLKRSNNAPHGYVGETVPMGKVKALAALLDCTDERIANVREFAGIKGDIFLSEEEAMKRLELKEIAQEMCLAALPDNEMDLEAISKPGASLTDLREYCFDQLAKASTDKEMSAAVALMEMLSDRIGTDDAQELQRLSDRAKITGRDKNTIRSA
ncbi:acyl-homoserine-lactone synthase [Cognatishimia maritima]|uniref:Acyl-homoserine-lactone synthase n=1 Tax=Cognatishimia maritima TaxID=870908 RepID=A0A1M5JKH4_9RHOB|nr:acyl-homoserine-lactone synthase [Cognatishimia maritima]SHG41062.1 N-acyl-L-homoserine lactone synthetase [Cognatishimia maritima]